MRRIATVIISLLAGWFLAVSLTWLGWTIQIEGTAFRCNDDIFPFVWWGENIDTHRRAGDILGAGWSWEKIQRMQVVYRAAYYGLWVSGAVVTYLLLGKRKARTTVEPDASTNAAPPQR